MIIQSLKLVQFKNFKKHNFVFGKKFNIIIGKNGTGKSSLLDAIYYLSLTKSFFVTRDILSIGFGFDFFTLQGMFFNNEQQYKVHLHVHNEKKKIVKYNEKKYQKLSEHIGKIPIVLISPYDSDLISGNSESRRRFIDSVIAQSNPKYLNDLIRYNKAIQQRNASLKSFKQNKIFDLISLEIYNEQLFKYGEYVYQKRKSFLSEYQILFRKYYKLISSSNIELVDLKYKSQLNKHDWSQLFYEYQQKDLYTCFTNCGVHKDDLEFNLFGLQIKKIGSQGQQKTFLIALKFAQYEYFKSKLVFTQPIMILDDIFDKLDIDRVEKLIKLVNESEFGQIFISHTNKSEFQKMINFLPDELINYTEL